jgi:hypothetical protein
MRQLSIRGRVAFAAACVEVAMQHFKVTHVDARAFLETLWDFCESENLLDWEEQIQVLHPIHWQEAGLLHLEPQVQSKLQDLCADAIAVGTRNLYSDYRSLETEESLEDVIRHVQALNLELPDLALFRFSKASEAKGWGHAFDPSELRANLKRGIP